MAEFNDQDAIQMFQMHYEASRELQHAMTAKDVTADQMDAIKEDYQKAIGNVLAIRFGSDRRQTVEDFCDSTGVFGEIDQYFANAKAQPTRVALLTHMFAKGDQAVQSKVTIPYFSRLEAKGSPKHTESQADYRLGKFLERTQDL